VHNFLLITFHFTLHTTRCQYQIATGSHLRHSYLEPWCKESKLHCLLSWVLVFCCVQFRTTYMLSLPACFKPSLSSVKPFLIPENSVIHAKVGVTLRSMFRSTGSKGLTVRWKKNKRYNLQQDKYIYRV